VWDKVRRKESVKLVGKGTELIAVKTWSQHRFSKRMRDEL
jgi:hypothetical protein